MNISPFFSLYPPLPLLLIPSLTPLCLLSASPLGCSTSLIPNSSFTCLSSSLSPSTLLSLCSDARQMVQTTNVFLKLKGHHTHHNKRRNDKEAGDFQDMLLILFTIQCKYTYAFMVFLHCDSTSVPVLTMVKRNGRIHCSDVFSGSVIVACENHISGHLKPFPQSTAKPP